MNSYQSFIPNTIIYFLTIILFFVAGCGLQASNRPVISSELAPQSWVALGKPGPSHNLLEMFVGAWKTETRTYFDDNNIQLESVGTPPTSLGTAKIGWILGKRFLQESYSGELQQVPYEGLGLLGYDNATRAYSNVWLDSLSTTVLTSKGKYFTEEHKFEFIGEVYDPLSNRTRSVKTEILIETENKYIVITYENDEGSMYKKTLETVYKRVG